MLRRLKGPERPVRSEAERAYVLAPITVGVDPAAPSLASAFGSLRTNSEIAAARESDSHLYEFFIGGWDHKRFLADELVRRGDVAGGLDEADLALGLKAGAAVPSANHCCHCFTSSGTTNRMASPGPIHDGACTLAMTCCLRALHSAPEWGMGVEKDLGPTRRTLLGEVLIAEASGKSTMRIALKSVAGELPTKTSDQTTAR